MSTVLAPELSRKNTYFIPKHRMYELKHYCLQYHYWVDALADINFIQTHGLSFARIKSPAISDPTADIAEIRETLIKNVDTVERCARLSDPIIGPYILRAVIEGWGYDKIKARENVPCSKETYYKLYRKFFWLLDKQRQ